MKIKRLIMALTAAGCLTLSSGVVMAETVSTTTLGTIELPAGVTLFDASKSTMVEQLIANIKKQLEPSSAKGVTATVPVNLKTDKDIFQTNNLYQLKGQDKTGYRTALLVSAVIPQKDLPAGWQRFTKPALNEVESSALLAANLGFMNAQGMLNLVLKQQKALHPDLPNVTVTVADITPIQRLPGTEKVIYEAGARVLTDVDGLAVPVYLRAYVLERNGQVVANLVLTSDVERDFFIPVSDHIFRSIR